LNKPSNLPAEYRSALAAMAKLDRIDHVKTFRDKAKAMEVYAYQAKDVSLVEPALSTKRLAERRIGELMEDQRKAGLLAKGAIQRGVGKRGSPADPRSLASQGVDKHLADRARKAAAMTEAKFEAHVRKSIRIAIAAILHHDEVIREARAERHAVKKARRQRRMKDLAEKIAALPVKKYPVVYADPEWQWEAWSEKGIDSTSADNHYPTSPLKAIKARDVPSICADDCVLFLWATAPMLPQALEVMDAWGFNYVSNFVWVKDKAGTGYWSRNQHEHLLIGTKGNLPAPLEGTQWRSVIEAKRGKHSEKPETVYDLIESYYPGLPKIELNARKAREGWDRWGNEAPEAEAAE
jgi:N6-adenosine-specific RNA methylase IME4